MAEPVMPLDNTSIRARARYRDHASKLGARINSFCEYSITYKGPAFAPTKNIKATYKGPNIDQ